MACTPLRRSRVATPDTSHPPVAWEGWGTSLAWFANALGQDPSTRSMVAQLLFSRDQGLGMNIVRYNIGGANLEQVKDYRPGGAVPCFARPDGTYVWDADPGQVALLLAAAQLGADTFEAFVNSPPFFWTVSQCSRGHQHPMRSNLDKQHIHSFAKFCADVVAHFAAAHGITFQSLSPFNEPSSPAWCLAANCRQEACFFSRARAHKVLRALLEQPSLQDTRLAVFDQFCIRDTLGDLQHLPKDLRGRAVGRVNTHTYNSSVFFSRLRAAPLVPFQDSGLARRRLRRLLRTRFGGTPLWVSEFGTGRGALQLARHIVRDLSTLLPSAWVYWQAVEGLGSNWGLLEMPIQHPGCAEAGTKAAATASGAGAAPGFGADGVAAGVRGPEAAGVAVAAAAAAGAAGQAEPAAAAPQSTSSAATNGRQGAASDVAAAQQQQTPPPPPPQQQQQQLAQAVLHPNFFVVQFLMQSLPAGSLLCSVKGFGKRGFAAWRGSSWSLVYVNPGSKPRSFRVAAGSFPAAPPAPAAAHGSPGSAPGPPAGREGPATPGGDRLLLHLLDVKGLQPQTVQGGLSRAQAAGEWQRAELQLGVDGGCTVVVPPGHLCRVDGPCLAESS